MLREYLLRITAASLSCGILTGILGEKGTTGKTLRFICGMVMVISVFGPLARVEIGSVLTYADQIQTDVEKVVSYGRETFRENSTAIIKEKTAAYILNKAKHYDTNLSVTVETSSEAPYAPCAVTISGAVSPYTRKVLSELISGELGISTEAQIWTP